VAETLPENLSVRKQKFVAEILRNGGNAAAAAREAGYCKNSPQSAKSRGHALLKDPAVKAAIEAARGNIITKAGYDIQASLAEIDEHIAGAKAAKQWSAVATLNATKNKVAGLMINNDARAVAGLQIRIVGIDAVSTHTVDAEVAPVGTDNNG
jgi:phage terminase small subunit